MGKKVQTLAERMRHNRLLWMDIQRRFTIQQCADYAAIVLHDEFGFGKDRCNRFLEAFATNIADHILTAIEDRKVDPNLAVTKENMDARLREIFGEDTICWDKRYAFVDRLEKEAKGM